MPGQVLIQRAGAEGAVTAGRGATTVTDLGIPDVTESSSQAVVYAAEQVARATKWENGGSVWSPDGTNVAGSLHRQRIVLRCVLNEFTKNPVEKLRSRQPSCNSAHGSWPIPQRCQAKSAPNWANPQTKEEPNV